MRRELFALSLKRGPGVRCPWQKRKDNFRIQMSNGRELQQGKVRASAKQYTYGWYTTELERLCTTTQPVHSKGSASSVVVRRGLALEDGADTHLQDSLAVRSYGHQCQSYLRQSPSSSSRRKRQEDVRSGKRSSVATRRRSMHVYYFSFAARCA